MNSINSKTEWQVWVFHVIEKELNITPKKKEKK